MLKTNITIFLKYNIIGIVLYTIICFLRLFQIPNNVCDVCMYRIPNLKIVCCSYKIKSNKIKMLFVVHNNTLN